MSGLRFVTAQHVRHAGPGWMLKRVTLNGQDVTDVPLDLREHDVNGLEIVSDDARVDGDGDGDRRRRTNRSRTSAW